MSPSYDEKETEESGKRIRVTWKKGQKYANRQKSDSQLMVIERNRSFFHSSRFHKEFRVGKRVFRMHLIIPAIKVGRRSERFNVFRKKEAHDKV